MTEWVSIGLAVAVAISNLIAWANRQQLTALKAEMAMAIAAMELRLSEKINASYVGWQAHNDLEMRVRRLESKVYHAEAMGGEGPSWKPEH